jgi:hypothetical protein
MVTCAGFNSVLVLALIQISDLLCATIFIGRTS